jgi:hypothetical protein
VCFWHFHRLRPRSFGARESNRASDYRSVTDTQYGRVLTAWESTSGQWVGPAVLYGDTGVGPVAAIRRGGTGHIMIFQRNGWGGISLTGQVAPNDIFVPQWNLRSGADSYYTFLEYPTATTDNLGRVVFLAKHPDGRLYFQRESSVAAVGDFGDWDIAGN